MGASFHHIGLAGLTLVGVVSCGNMVTSPGSPTLASHPQLLHEWHDDGGPGQVSITISLSDQIAQFKRGERDIGWSYVATGKEGHDTAPGSYAIQEKLVDKHSGSFGCIQDGSGNVVNDDATPGSSVPRGCHYVPAPMPYWMRITSYGVGMHGGYIPNPGSPASHGCIRLPKDFAPELYSVVHVGTPVHIVSGPSQSTMWASHQGGYAEPMPVSTAPVYTQPVGVSTSYRDFKPPYVPESLKPSDL